MDVPQLLPGKWDQENTFPQVLGLFAISGAFAALSNLAVATRQWQKHKHPLEQLKLLFWTWHEKESGERGQNPAILCSQWISYRVSEFSFNNLWLQLQDGEDRYLQPHWRVHKWGSSNPVQPVRITIPKLSHLASCFHGDPPWHQVRECHWVWQVGWQAYWLRPHGWPKGYIHKPVSTAIKILAFIFLFSSPNLFTAKSIHFIFEQHLIHLPLSQSAQQAVRKIDGLAYKGKRLKVELSNT